MSKASLRRLVGFFLIFFSIQASAQQYHFIYLQTDNEQPFYVKLNNKILSSSSAGYLILPRMTEGNYNLTVGFPKNEYPEQNFNVNVSDADEGYLVKNFGEKGWGLFNLQSFAITMSANSAGIQSVDTTAKVYTSDPFSKMLANVVKDSTILQKQEPPKTIAETNVGKQPDSSVATVTSDTVTLPAAHNPATTIEERRDTVLTGIVQADSNKTEHRDILPVAVSNASINYFIPPHKVFSDKSEDGFTMMFVDTFPNLRDTVLIFIPADTANMNPVDRNSMLDSNNTVQENIIQPRADSTLKTSSEKGAMGDTTSSMPPLVTIKNYLPPVADTVKSQNKKEVVSGDSGIQAQQINNSQNEGLPEVVTSSKTNSDCKAFADNNDFLKLRKKMASESSDENMIKVAKKYFKSKCFSTEQIKNLSFLFLTNQGKYEFFDAAYAFVSDSEKYYTLESQFTDTYYLNRFRAMVQR
ncbi:MAG TPA: DUF4476 domain-containing protein [Chitinophagaceae bacterium]|nr:DUF4476 domain-containing protein [Chitinophagaceae bacterium]